MPDKNPLLDIQLPSEESSSNPLLDIELPSVDLKKKESTVSTEDIQPEKTTSKQSGGILDRLTQPVLSQLQSASSTSKSEPATSVSIKETIAEPQASGVSDIGSVKTTVSGMIPQETKGVQSGDAPVVIPTSKKDQLKTEIAQRTAAINSEYTSFMSQYGAVSSEVGKQVEVLNNPAADPLQKQYAQSILEQNAPMIKDMETKKAQYSALAGDYLNSIDSAKRELDGIIKADKGEDSYAGGAGKAIAMGTADIFDSMQGANDFLSKYVFGYEPAPSGGYSQFANYIRETAQENVADMPDTYTGKVLEGVAGSIPIIVTTMLAPETAIPKFATALGAVGFGKAYHETGDVLSAVKAGGYGITEGALLHGLGVAGGTIGEWAAKTKLGEGIGKELTGNAAAALITSTGFGTQDAIAQYLETGKVDMDQVAASFGTGLAFSLPGLAKASYERAFTKTVSANPVAVTEAIELPQTPLELRSKAAEILEAAVGGSEKDKAEAYLAAKALSGMADVKAIGTDIAKNPTDHIADVKASDAPEEMKAKAISNINEIASANNEGLRATQRLRQEKADLSVKLGSVEDISDPDLRNSERARVEGEIKAKQEEIDAILNKQVSETIKTKTNESESKKASQEGGKEIGKEVGVEKNVLETQKTPPAAEVVDGGVFETTDKAGNKYYFQKKGGKDVSITKVEYDKLSAEREKFGVKELVDSGGFPVNPIDRTLPTEKKVEKLVELRKENEPVIKGIVDKIKSFGIEASFSMKKVETIAKKAVRFVKRLKNPEYNVEHINDAIRFEAVVDDFTQMKDITAALKESGVEIVNTKAAIDQLYNPKEFGWQSLNLDLRMPNGQLVEFQVRSKEFDAIKQPKVEGERTPDMEYMHDIYEKWRDRDIENLTPDETLEYLDDLQRSNKIAEDAAREYAKKADLPFTEEKSVIESLLKGGEIDKEIERAKQNVEEPAVPLKKELAFTTATKYGLTDVSKRIKGFSDRFHDVVEALVKNPGDVLLSREFKRLQDGILSYAKKRIGAKAKELGVKVSFGKPYIGKWEGKNEPSFNLSYEAPDRTAELDFLEHITDMAEETQQDAFIVSEKSEFNGTDLVPLTESRGDHLHYPEVNVTFGKPLTVEQQAFVAGELNKAGIESYSIGENNFKVSIIDFKNETPESKNEHHDEQIRIIRGIEEKLDSESGIRSTLGYSIRKARYFGATNEGSLDPRKYERNNLLETSEKESGVKLPSETKKYATKKGEITKGGEPEYIEDGSRRTTTKAGDSDSAKPGEAGQPKEKTVTASRAAIDLERAESNQPELTEGAYRGWDSTVIKEAKDKVASGEVDSALLVDQLIGDKSKRITDTDVVVVLGELIKLQDKYDNVVDLIDKAPVDMDPARLASLSIQQIAIENRKTAIHQMLRDKGRQTAQTLAAYRIIMKKDMSRLAVLARGRAAEVGKEIPERVKEIYEKSVKTIEEQSKRISEIEKELAEKTKKLEAVFKSADLAKAARREKILQEAEERKTGRKATKEEIQAERTQLFENLKRLSIEQRSTLSANPINAKMVIELGKIARNYIKEGIVDVAQIVDDIHLHLKTSLPNVTKEDIENAIGDVITTEAIKEARSDSKNIKQGQTIEQMQARLEYNLNRSIDEYKKKLESGDFSANKKALKTPLTEKLAELIKERDDVRNKYKEAKAADVKSKKAESDINNTVKNRQAANRGGFEKGLELIQKLYKAKILSGVMTPVKLAAAVVNIAALKPAYMGVGNLLAQLPGLKPLYAKAPMQRMGTDALAKYYSTMASKETFKESYRTIMKGSNFDYMHGEKGFDDSGILGLPGRSHAAVKVFAKLPEYEAAKLQLTKDMLDKGEDPFTKENMAEIETLSVESALNSVLMDDNKVAALWNNFLLAASKSESDGIKALSTLLSVEDPIVKVPLNQAAAIWEHLPIIGLIQRIGQIRRGASAEGGFTKQEANEIARNINRQGLGLLIAGAASMLYENLGGYQDWKSKQDKEIGIEEMGLKVGEFDVPKLFLHNGAWGIAQIFATIAREAKGGKGVVAGSGKALAGLAEEDVPFVRSAVDMAKTVEILKSGGLSKAAGKFVGDFITTSDARKLAKYIDEGRKTNPQGFWEAVANDVPGLRKFVTSAEDVYFAKKWSAQQGRRAPLTEEEKSSKMESSKNRYETAKRFMEWKKKNKLSR